MIIPRRNLCQYDPPGCIVGMTGDRQHIRVLSHSADEVRQALACMYALEVQTDSFAGGPGPIILHLRNVAYILPPVEAPT